MIIYQYMYTVMFFIGIDYWHDLLSVYRLFELRDILVNRYVIVCMF